MQPDCVGVMIDRALLSTYDKLNGGDSVTMMRIGQKVLRT
jgi:hypothetical protein